MTTAAAASRGISRRQSALPDRDRRTAARAGQQAMPWRAEGGRGRGRGPPASHGRRSGSCRAWPGVGSIGTLQVASPSALRRWTPKGSSTPVAVEPPCITSGSAIRSSGRDDRACLRSGASATTTFGIARNTAWSMAFAKPKRSLSSWATSTSWKTFAVTQPADRATVKLCRSATGTRCL